MGASIIEPPVSDPEPVTGDQAEATRTAANLFQFSAYVHAGAGAEECEHRSDGQCRDDTHFHAWVCLPNQLQHRDIQEKARAAKARRRRAMRDGGDGERAASDAFVILESELDDLLNGTPRERDALLTRLSNRAVNRTYDDNIEAVRDGDDRFENYLQDLEELGRLETLPEEQRPEEYAALAQLRNDFADAVDERAAEQRAREKERLGSLDPGALRILVRDMRIDGESADAFWNTYYTWLEFVSTRKCPGHVTATRYFPSVEAMKSAAPEVIAALEAVIRDLEGRQQRGEAAGN